MNHRQHLDTKIFSKEDLLRKCSIWKFKGEKIVFSNGVFDLLHAGHVDYLSRTASFGTKLVVGLNTDQSVKRLKGPERPINDQKARSLVLSSLEFIDAICLFDEDTPAELIRELKPDVLVKGADYKVEEIVGAEFVLKNGGEVKTIELLEGFSSTNMISKIRGEKLKKE